MKKVSTLVSFVFILLNGMAQENISIIPEPVKINRNQGHFILPSVITMNADENKELRTALAELTDQLTTATGYQVTTTKSGSAVIHLSLNKTANPELGNEGYQLTVTAKNVNITANQPAGIFYGVQSFLQLLPPEIASGTRESGITWSAPCVSITDYPRFGWRGLMLWRGINTMCCTSI
jgi:hexosaminidase